MWIRCCKKKTRARLLLLESSERRKERRGRNKLAFSPHTQKSSKRRRFSREELSFLGNASAQFLGVFFCECVHVSNRNEDTSTRRIFFIFSLSALCLSHRKTNSLLSKRALELEATSPRHRETIRRRSKTPSPVSPTGTPTKALARKNSRRRRRKPRRKRKKKPPPREEPPRPRRWRKSAKRLDTKVPSSKYWVSP